MGAIHKSLLELQGTLKVEKGQYNSFGKYKYRSKEDILEAAKPLCRERGLLLLCEDEVVQVDDGWVYVKTTATLMDAETGEVVSASGWAREPEEKKGMDASQITGTASSYAGKRALGNLFAIDDTKDSDAYQGASQQAPQDGPFIGACTACGTRYSFQSREQMAQSACRCGNRTFTVEG